MYRYVGHKGSYGIAVRGSGAQRETSGRKATATAGPEAHAAVDGRFEGRKHSSGPRIRRPQP